MLRLEDKIALIADGSRGIGAATADLFATHGAEFTVVDLLVAEGEALASRIGGAVLPVRCV